MKMKIFNYMLLMIMIYVMFILWDLREDNRVTYGSGGGDWIIQERDHLKISW